MPADQSKDKKETARAAAKRFAASGADSQERAQVADAIRALAGIDDDEKVYVAKLTNAGLHNQVWQGKSLSEQNAVMFFLDQTQSHENVLQAVKNRLNPRLDSGFDAVVVAEKTSDGWEVKDVIEYDHVQTGERLSQLMGKDFAISKVRDPSASGGNRYPDDHSSDAADSESITVDELKMHLLEAKNVVLEGAPGTGKTTLAMQLAEKLAGDRADQFRLENLLAGRSIEQSREHLASAPIVWEIANQSQSTS